MQSSLLVYRHSIWKIQLIYLPIDSQTSLFLDFKFKGSDISISALGCGLRDSFLIFNLRRLLPLDHLCNDFQICHSLRVFCHFDEFMGLNIKWAITNMIGFISYYNDWNISYNEIVTSIRIELKVFCPIFIKEFHLLFNTLTENYILIYNHSSLFLFSLLFSWHLELIIINNNINIIIIMLLNYINNNKYNYAT